MPTLRLKSTTTGVSRLNTKTEDTIDLRQSVSVQMKIRIPDAVHPTAAGLGITLYNLTENPDPNNNSVKKLRILSPTVSGSDNSFRVMLDDTIVVSETCSHMSSSIENLVEYRFWQEVLDFKVQYLLNGVEQSTLSIQKSLLTDSLRFRVGVTISDEVEVNIYTLNISRKNKVAKTVRVQGTGQLSIPDGNSVVLLKGTGGPGKLTTFKLSRAVTANVESLVTGSCFVDDVADTKIDFGPILAQNSQCVVINANSANDATSSYANARSTDMLQSFQKILLPTNSAIDSIVVLNDYFYFTYKNYRGTSAVPANNLYRTRDFISNELVSTGLAFNRLELGVLFVENVGDVLLITETGNTRYYLSTDGETFDEYFASFAISVTKIQKLSNSFIAYINQNTARYKSSDLITWVLMNNVNHTPSSAGPAQYGQKYIRAYGSGILAYKLNNENKVAYSLDGGETFLEYVHPEDFTYLLFGNGSFVLYSDKYTNTPSYATTDFSNVTQIPNTAGVLGNLCLFEMNKFISIDYDTLVTKISSNFTQWEQIVSYPKMKTSTHVQGIYAHALKEHVVLRMMTFNASGRPMVRQSTKTGTTVGVVLMSTLSVGTSEDGVDGSQVLVDITDENYTFPTTKTQAIAAPLTRVAPVPASNALVNFDAPTDAFLEMTYIDDQFNGLVRNEFIREGCSGVDKVRFYADGTGGEYVDIISKNSPDCGYVADTLKSVVLTGKDRLELPAGLTTIEVSGRGSSSIDKTIAVTNSVIPVSFDRIINDDIKQINEVAYGNGQYVVLCNSDSETFETSTLIRSKHVYVGSSLSNLVKVNFPATYLFTFATYFSNTLIIQGSNSGAPFVLTCTVGGSAVADWTVLTSVPGVQDNTKLVPTPTHLVTLSGKFFSISADAITFNNRNWAGSNYRDHEPIGIVVTPNLVVSYGATSLYTNNGPTGESWLLMTFGGTMENALITNQWSNRSVYVGYPSDSSDPQVIKNYNDTRTMFEGNAAAATKRGITSMAYGNGKFFGIVGFYFYQDFGTDPLTYNLLNDTAPGFEIRATESQLTFLCWKSEFTPYATVVFTEGQFVVTDKGNVFTSATAEPGSWTQVLLDPSIKNQIRSAYAFGLNTYYNTLVSGIVYSTKKYPGDQYVTKLPVRGEDAVVGVDKTYLIFPGNKTSSAPANTLLTNVALNSAQETNIVYDCPPGSVVTLKYMSVNDNAPVAGTLLTTLCDGFNKYNVYANGVGGTYQTLATLNSPDCGWTAPVVRANVSYNETVNIKEMESTSIFYTLNNSLNVPVRFIFSINYGAGATQSDFDNLRVAIGLDSSMPLFTGEEIIIPAGQTQFKISFTALNDYANEAVESSTFVLTPSTNASRIVNTVLATTVVMTSLNSAVSAESFDTANSDGVKTILFTNKIGAGYTNHQQVVKSQAFVTAGRYSVEVLQLTHTTGIIGFVNDNSLTSNNGQHVYPGHDVNSWGFSSSGNYHNGSIVSTGPAWTKDTKLILMYDADTGTAELIVDYQRVGNVITGINGNIRLAVGSVVNNKSVSFYINLGQNLFSQPAIDSIPVDYFRGFGTLIDESWWGPEYNPAESDLNMTPSGITGPVANQVIQSGITVAHSLYRPQTVVAVNDGTAVVEIKLLSKDIQRIGIHPNNFSGIAGNSNNSWAIISDGSAVVHDSVNTPLAVLLEPATVVTLVFNLVLKRVQVRFNGTLRHTFENVPTMANLVVSVATATTQANGGTLVFINSGQSVMDYFIQGVTNALGVFNGNPQFNTIVSGYCSGQDLFVMRADGSGSTFSESYRRNSTVCGYIPPVDSVSGWAYNLKGENVTYGQNGSYIDFSDRASLLGYIQATSGKYYWEVRSNEVWVGVGATTMDVEGDATGQESALVVSLIDGYTISNYSYFDTLVSRFYTDMYGKWVGFMLDLDARKLSVRFENLDVIEVIDFTNTLLPAALRPLIYCNSNVLGVHVNMGQEPYYNPIPPGYSSWLTGPVQPSAYYLDDFVNNNKNFTGTTFEDYYNPTSSPVDLVVQYNNTPGAGFLSLKETETDNNSYWIRPYQPPMLSQMRATFEFDIPNISIMRNGYLAAVPFDYVLATDGTEQYTTRRFNFSVFTGNASIENGPIEVTLTYDNTTTRTSTLRGGTGFAVAAPSFRRFGGTQTSVTIAPSLTQKFVIEVMNDVDNACKVSSVYLNDQLLGTILHEGTPASQLISIAANTTNAVQVNSDVGFDNVVIKLKKVRFDDLT